MPNIKTKNAIVIVKTFFMYLLCSHKLKTGCNAFKDGHGKSTPMGFWTRQDISLVYPESLNTIVAGQLIERK